MSNKAHHTIEAILQRLNSDDRALERALVIIYENATDIQRYKFDFQFQFLVLKIKLPHCLSGSQLYYARQKLAQVKYAGILRRCADQIMEGEG